jgi:hypothetical protein
VTFANERSITPAARPPMPAPTMTTRSRGVDMMLWWLPDAERGMIIIHPSELINCAAIDCYSQQIALTHG